MAKPARRLPEETLPRIRALVAQSRPDPDRPRLTPELERRFAQVDAEAAACFAASENITDRILRLADDDKANGVTRVWPPDGEG